MRLLSFIVTLFISLPLTLLALSIALSNRDALALRVWPFNQNFDVAAGTAGAVLLGLGFLAGALFVSVIAQRTRLRLWQQERRASRLDADLKAAETKLAALTVADDPRPMPPAAPGTPQLGTQASLRDVESAPYRF